MIMIPNFVCNTVAARQERGGRGEEHGGEEHGGERAAGSARRGARGGERALGSTRVGRNGTEVVACEL